ncbi:MAG: hybrid sensor histidine kinase/response regulator, partial [Gammaproteobacteria bacterium]
MQDAQAASTEAAGEIGIERERAALYLRQRPTLRLGNLALQLVCVVLLWPVASPELLTLWVALNVALMAARSLGMRPLTRGDIDEPAQIRRWFRTLAVYLFVGGVTWGGGALVFMPVDDQLRLSLFLLILMGLAWGAVASVSMYFPAVIAFIVPLSLLTALGLAGSGTDTATLLVLLTLAFLLFTVVTARNYARSIDKTLYLAAENLRLLAAVTAARDAAERTSAEKSRFLATLSHDVRQPLYAAGLFLESLGARLTSDTQREVYANAARSLAAVDELFNAVLEISRLDNAPPRARRETFDVAALAAGLRIEFSAEARRKGLALHFSSAHSLVETDSVLVMRVLRNLISNALKNTAQGSISLVTEAVPGGLRVAVEDTGIGIDPADHERVFDEYYQVRNRTLDHSGGLGLGLAVVKRLCRLLNTTISLESSPGRGARFSFVLPAGTSADLPPEVVDVPHDLVGIHVLLIEDDEAVREGLTLMLGDWSCHVSAGADVTAALAQADAHRRPVDIVISDYRLADAKNGVEAIRTARERFDNALPALLLSADAGAAVT